MSRLSRAQPLRSLAAAALSLALASAAFLPSAAARSLEVNVYSYRQPFLIRPLMQRFTQETGIRVNIVYASKGILQRLRAEGAGTLADVVLAADVSRLVALKQAGLLRRVDSPLLRRHVPPHLRDPDDQWFALTKRARIIVAHRQRVQPGEVRAYEDLAAPHMKGRVCIRSGKHPYNLALFASFIAHKGEEETRRYLQALKGNLARRPQGNDRAQARAIYEGRCDVALLNSYYLGKMATNGKKPEQKKWYAALRVIFPNQDDRGTHVNITGAAITRHAKNPENAKKLLEFLISEEAQRIYAAEIHEYPVRADVPLSALVRSWGDFREDALPLSEIARHVPAAARLVDEVRFDH